MAESEKVTERHLSKEMLRIRGLSFKWVCPNVRGVPDRICIFPNGSTHYAEIKSEGKAAEDHQLRLHRAIRKLSATVDILETKAQVDEFIKKYNI